MYTCIYIHIYIYNFYIYIILYIVIIFICYIIFSNHCIVIQTDKKLYFFVQTSVCSWRKDPYKSPLAWDRDKEHGSGYMHIA